MMSQWDLNEELLKDMHKEAVLTNLRAKALMFQYEMSFRRFWRKRLTEHLDKIVCKGVELECKLRLDTGVENVLVSDVGLDWKDGRPVLEYRRKTKSGKWGKTVFTSDLEQSLKSLRVANKNNRRG